MRYKKMLLTIFIIVCVLFSISNVMASDLNETAIANEDEQQLIEETNIETITTNNEENIATTDNGTFSALENKINNAEEGSTIVLENNYTCENNYLTISKAITIDGNGHSINANSKQFSFKITDTAQFVTIKNLTFIKCNPFKDIGGIIYNEGTNSKIESCNFINSKSDDGAGIYNLAENCTIKSCNFTKGSIEYAIWNDFGKNCVITSCMFTDIQVGMRTIENWGDYCKINSCFFKNIENGIGTGNLGDINKVGRYCTIDSCSFINCENAISNFAQSSIDSCNFTNCTSVEGLVYNEASDCTLNSCIFTNCSDSYGGIVYNFKSNNRYAKCTANDCKFNNITYKAAGTNVEFVECSFKDSVSPELKISISNFEENSNSLIIVLLDQVYSGQVYTGDVTVKILNTTKTYTIPVKNGRGNVTIDSLPSGNYTAVATSSETGLFKVSENTTTFEVTASKNDNPTSNSTDINKTEDTTVVDSKIVASNLNTVYTSGSAFKVTVYGTDGKLASGVSVVIKVAGKTVATVKTTNGIATYKTTQNPGTYKISATALGKTVTKTLSVKHLVTLKSISVKRSAKKLVIQASLAKVNGKYLKSKKITFKFNGKKYTAKTNSKGVAKVTIKSNVLKKLKAGKKVTYQATYLKDTVKKTVKIKK